MERSALDTAVYAETPEGIVIELRPAGFPARCFAFIIDSFVRMMMMYVVAIAALLLKSKGPGTGAIVLISMFLLEWLYPVFFELSRWGATPGKRTFNLKVVMDNGLPITPAASLTRNLLRVADFLPLLYAFGILSILLRKDCKRLGDIAASTMVIYQLNKAKPVSLPNVEPLAPAYPLPPADQACVMALAARASKITAERLDELAALAAPISNDNGRSGPQVTRRVLGVAQWLLGKRQ
jgi:uncharacterized RDD family membrane protein YckC